MNKKSFSLLVFCMMFIQVVMLNFGATEVEKSYAPVNPTPAQVAAANPTDIVVFGDSVLEAQIATDLRVVAGEITVNDMMNLNTLTIMTNNITSLEGIQYATNLTYLDIFNTSITELTPISNLTSLTKFVVAQNRVNNLTPLTNLTNLTELRINDVVGATDLTPLAGLTNLTVLEIDRVDVKDITPLSNLTNLTDLRLPNNLITDFSPILPLLEDDIYTNIDLLNQGYSLEDIIVTNDNELIYDITGLHGEKIPVSLGVPRSGYNMLFNVAVSKNNELNGKMEYSVLVYQAVIYIKFDGLKNASINEEQELTDEELIALFEVVNEANDAITVDASAVNYSTPGEYQVEFSLANGAKLNPTLKVLDIKPTIEISNNIVSIEANSQVPNLIEVFGVTATEITDGDLTASITVDDSAVNYSKAGTYNVKFAVTDPEGNPVTNTAKLEITPEQEINVEEKNSEEKIEVNSETSSQKENEEKTTTSEKSESTVAMTDNNKQGLASTGYRTTILIVALSAIAAILLTLKKISVSKN